MSLQYEAEATPALLDQNNLRMEDIKEDVKTGNGKTYGQKLKYTIYVYFVSIGMGALFALTTTSFLDLMSHTSSDIDQGALIFMLNALGYTIGSLVSGFLYDWCNKDIIFGGSAVLAGFFIALVPVTKMFPMVVTLLFMSNLFQGTIDSGCTLLCAIVWGDDANPYQQGLYLFYSLGGIVAPFVAEPFLLKSPEDALNVSVLDTALSNVTDSSPVSSPFANNKLIVPFVIMGVYCVLTSLPFIVMFIQTKIAPVVQTNINRQKDDRKETIKVNRKMLVVACLLLAVFFTAQGYIYGLGEFSMPFLVDFLGWSKTEGTRLNSVIWAAMTGGSFVGIFLAKILRPSVMVVVNLIPITCGLIAILVAAKAHSIVVWISYIAVFFGTGSIYPSMISWVDQRLIRVNGRICSIFTISGCIGDITNVMLLGYLFKHHSPMWLLYLTMGSVVVVWIGLIILFRTNKLLSKHISPDLCKEFISRDVKETVERKTEV